MSEIWSAETLQVCHVAAAVALVDIVVLLHACHSLLHSLQHLSLHNQYLLQCWWWRRVSIVVVVVLIRDTVASVGHLMIVKIFEIEIQDSQLYASSYNDD
jgi:hypothetical protein